MRTATRRALMGAAAALAVVAFASVPAGAAAAAPAAPLIGIADQKADMFSDPRFGALKIRHARLTVAWDAFSSPWQFAELDAWLQAARARGVEPLVSFARSRTERYALPTPERLRYEMRRFRQIYPWVTAFATWNEANHCGEPTCHRPGLVAAYYRAMRAECPPCTILAAELLDLPGVARWVRSLRRSLGFTPRYWGLHNYVEANRFRADRLRSVLRATPGADLWLTETGGLVSRRNASTTDIPEGPLHAGDVTRFIFDRIVPENPRVTRVYVYHWNAQSPLATWDSALIAPGGETRPSFAVLRRVLLQGPRPWFVVRPSARRGAVGSAGDRRLRSLQGR